MFAKFQNYSADFYRVTNHVIYPHALRHLLTGKCIGMHTYTRTLYMYICMVQHTFHFKKFAYVSSIGSYTIIAFWKIRLIRSRVFRSFIAYVLT